MKLIAMLFFAMLFCLSWVSATIEPQKDFDLQKFAGKWYRVASASNSPRFAHYKDKLRVAMVVMTPQENGDINATVWKQKSSGCYNTAVTYQKTAVPGKFTYFCKSHLRTKEIIVVETDYVEYALTLKYKDRTKEFSYLSLYTRREKLEPEPLEKLKEFSLSQGLPKESVVIMPAPREDCLPNNV